ncbi:MAG TPA: DNA polymerase I [Planctomycetes bacterium]|nr:DNA polymerase I [Planctomycetota bacterium]
MASTLYLIDGHYQIYRGFFGMRPLTNSQGMQVQAAYALTDLLFRLRRDFPIDHWAIALDSPEPTFRHHRFPQYKATREEMPEELKQQLPSIDRIIEGFRIPVLRAPGFEADDLIATAAVLADRAGFDVRILSRDKDLEQVLSDRVQFLDERNGDTYGPPELATKKGIRPDQVIQYQALVGDTSDNVPGVKGVGPKGAVKVLSIIEDIEQLLEDPVPEGIPPATLKKVRACAEEMILSRWLVELRHDAPLGVEIEQLVAADPDIDSLEQVFLDLGFRRFQKQLADEQRPEAGSGSQGSLFGTPDEPTSRRAPIEGARYHLVVDPDELDSLLDRCQKAGTFAFDTETTGLDPIGVRAVGFSIAIEPGEAWYVPLESPAGELPLSRDQILSKLKPLLEDEGIGKIGQNMKYDAQVMRSSGIDIRGISGDPMIEAYLINPLRGSYKLDDLVGERFGHRMIPISEIIGPRGEEITMAQIEPEKISDYAAEDADYTLRLHRELRAEAEEMGLLRVLDEIELPLVEVLVAMEREGITLDKSRLEEQEEEVARSIISLAEEIHDDAGEEFNIASPKQLQHILFDVKGLPARHKTKTGFSVSADVLEELAVEHPDEVLPGLLLEHRSLSKLLGTYLQALPKHIHPDTGRIHTDFRQTVAATGRLASTRPNLQNIPIRSEEGRRIRKAFVPNRASSCFLSADYSQIELRLLAHLSGDNLLVETLRAGEDIHSTVAARIYDKAPQDVTREERGAAKAVNFGLIYGMGAFGLARDLGISVAAAKEFIEAFFGQFPRVREWIEETKQGARETGEVRTIFGRRRPVPEIRSRLARERAQGERFAVNSVVQGSAADVIKLAMVRIHRILRDKIDAPRMILQIHDELLFEVDSDRVEEEERWICQQMEEVIELDVPMKVSVSSGKDWFDASK